MSLQRRVVDFVTDSPETSPRRPRNKRSATTVQVAVARAATATSFAGAVAARSAAAAATAPRAAAAAAGVAALPFIQLLGGSSDDDDDAVVMRGAYGGGGFGALSSQRRKRRRQQQLATNTNNTNQYPPAGRFKTDRDDDGNPIAFAPLPPPPPPVRAPPPPPPVVVLPEHQVLEYFPDADLPHVQSLLKKLVNVDGSNTPNVALVINYMAEKGYEKCQQGGQAARAAVAATAASAAAGSAAFATAVIVANGNTNTNNNPMLDFMSTESFTADFAYRNQAQLQLEHDFPSLSAIGARAILLSCKNHYAIAHDRIAAALKGTTTTVANKGVSLEEAQYNRLLTGMSGSTMEADQMQRLEDLLGNKSGQNRKACLKHARKNKAAPTITHEILLQEIQYVQHKLEAFLESGRRVKKRKLDQVQAQRDRTAVDCSCCFDGFPVADMVSCREEGHLFCIDCLKTCVEEQIFGQGNLGIDKRTKKPALEIQCFHGDGCSSGFDRELLEKALATKTLAKYDELQFKVSLEAAGLSLVSCPKCAFQVELPVGQKILTCPVLGCGFESCRECGGPAHIPLRCGEVKKEEKETVGRLTVEEAISAAKIRHCYKCNQPFVKSEGCNKITCSCGAKQCYVCRQAVSDYTHYCQTFECKHSNCNKCPLYSNAEQDDAREMREAGLKAAHDVRAKIQQESHMQVDIDVDQILKKPPPAGPAGRRRS